MSILYFKTESTFHNRYYGLRHAQAKSNTLNIVNGVVSYSERYPLTDEGIQQARNAQSSLRRELTNTPHIYCSDFLRTRQTAEIIAQGWVAEVHTTPLLRERNWGDFEETEILSAVRPFLETGVDEKDPDHTQHNFESINTVIARMSQFIKECEENFSGKDIIFISHGDPLRILEATLGGLLPGQYRKLHVQGNAEWRGFHLGMKPSLKSM